MSSYELARELATLGVLVSAHVESGLSEDDVIASLYRSWSDRISSLPQLATGGYRPHNCDSFRAMAGTRETCLLRACHAARWAIAA